MTRNPRKMERRLYIGIALHVMRTRPFVALFVLLGALEAVRLYDRVQHLRATRTRYVSRVYARVTPHLSFGTNHVIVSSVLPVSGARTRGYWKPAQSEARVGAVSRRYISASLKQQQRVGSVVTWWHTVTGALKRASHPTWGAPSYPRSSQILSPALGRRMHRMTPAALC